MFSFSRFHNFRSGISEEGGGCSISVAGFNFDERENMLLGRSQEVTFPWRACSFLLASTTSLLPTWLHEECYSARIFLEFLNKYFEHELFLLCTGIISYARNLQKCKRNSVGMRITRKAAIWRWDCPILYYTIKRHPKQLRVIEIVRCCKTFPGGVDKGHVHVQDCAIVLPPARCHLRLPIRCFVKLWWRRITKMCSF